MKTLLIQTKQLVMITLLMSVSSLLAQDAPDYSYELVANIAVTNTTVYTEIGMYM